MVTQKRLYVTLYVQCNACLVCNKLKLEINNLTIINDGNEQH